ncbi:MAG TPA: ABC transporter ATP-binding protein [Treponemataceae bacterium]|nr:ABC transporter ATP-binding protein [Treponemataceae bacterium]
MKNEALIVVKDAGRVYRQNDVMIEALKTASCKILPRARIAIVGPSGSGKSTLLHLMAALDSQTTGMVSWPALGTGRLRPAKIGYIPQEQSLVSTLTVSENVELPLIIMGKTRNVAASETMNILETLGLLEIAAKLPAEISGGQQKRAAMARALAARPEIILADEPTGQLDHETANLFLDAVLAYIGGMETALVIATHDREAARRMETTWKIRHGILETEIV